LQADLAIATSAGTTCSTSSVTTFRRRNGKLGPPIYPKTRVFSYLTYRQREKYCLAKELQERGGRRQRQRAATDNYSETRKAVAKEKVQERLGLRPTNGSSRSARTGSNASLAGRGWIAAVIVGVKITRLPAAIKKSSETNSLFSKSNLQA